MSNIMNYDPVYRTMVVVKPVMSIRELTRADMHRAERRIRPHIRWTPTMIVAGVDLGLPDIMPIALKCDSLQHTGSFKVRGALNRLLAEPGEIRGVTAASGGNHGKAVAWAGQRLGVPVHVFVPKSSPKAKQEAPRRYGATVTVVDGEYPVAAELSRRLAEAEGYLQVHPFDDLEVVAGQATCAAELERDYPEVDTVLVAVGGGGLIAGVASWFAGAAKVIAVETELTPTFASALAADRIVMIEPNGLCLSSLGAPHVGEYLWSHARKYIQGSVTVTDREVLQAQVMLWESCRLIAEPGGATALAALTSGRYRPEPGERTAVIVCGGNADVSF